MNNSLQATVFSRLASGDCINGQALAGALGVSRAAIWKAVQSLRDAGLPVTAIRGHGYQLTGMLPPPPLNETTLRAHLPENVSLQLHFSTGSTNDDARALTGDGFVLAEQQTRGRGRMGRQWMSVPGCSITLSGHWRLTGSLADLAGLNLALAVACVQTAAAFGWHLGLKWPNDLVTRDTNGQLLKVGGILVEINGEMEGPCQVIAGIGLNWQLPDQCQRAIGQPVANLVDLPPLSGATKPVAPTRTAFTGTLLATLDQAVRHWNHDNHESQQRYRRQVLETWRQHDTLCGQPVTILSPGAPSRPPQQGIYRGVDTQGALILEINGQKQAIHSGEVSVRPSKAFIEQPCRKTR